MKEVKDLDQELKQFVSEYSVENHNYAKKKAGILFAKNSKDISLFNTIGVLFLQNKKYEDSIKVFKKLINLNPKDINTLKMSIKAGKVTDRKEKIDNYKKKYNIL